MDQQAVFDADREGSDDRQEGCSDGFPLFWQLPLELREQIWTLCLPSRVVTPSGATRRPRPPLISQVCRESLRVALCPHFQVEVAGSRHGGTASYWLDKRTDAIYLEDRFDPRLEEVASLGLLAQVPIQVRETRVLFEYCISKGRSNLTSVDSCMARSRDCAVVLDYDLVLHMDRPRACETGLFGLFAEQKVATVDIVDEKQMDRLEWAVGSSRAPGRWLTRRPVRRWVPWATSRPSPLDFDIPRCLERTRALWLLTNGAIQDVCHFSLRMQMEPDVKARLDRLPRFSFVISVHLCLCQEQPCQEHDTRHAEHASVQ